MNKDEYTNQELMLPVGDGHELYVQDWGNAKAKTPIIFLHGGPGGGCNNGHKGYFDPANHHVIFFDQRGCSKSTPYGLLKNNITKDLIGDISKIADHFGLGKFILVGGSWGSCLSLAYALENPSRVAAMVLRGLFTGSKREIDWINNGQFRNFYPEIWDEYLARTPEDEQGNPSKYHVSKTLGSHRSAARQSAFAIEQVEGSLLRLDDRRNPTKLDEDFDPSSAIIETYFLDKLCFMPDRYILDHADKLTMPVWLVQGRYDMVCPPITAYELHKKLPNSHLIWTQAGHSGNDRENWLATKTILEQF